MYPNPAAGSTKAELEAAGYTLSDLFIIGFSATQLLNAAGYTAAELKEGVLDFVGVIQLTSLAYTAAQLQAAYFLAAELKSVGYTLFQLFDLGYTSTKLLEAGYTDAELKTAVLRGGFTSIQLTELGYTALQLQNAEFTVQELRTVGYTPNLLFDLGFTSTKLLDAGYTPVELKLAVIAGGEKTVEQLTALGYTAAQLQAEEYTATELKSVGYSLSQLLVTGYTTGALFDAGYTATEIQNAVPIPTEGGYTVTQLRDIGFMASQLRPAGYILPPLVDGGYTSQDLKDAAFVPAELLTHFPARELYNVFTTQLEQATVTKAVLTELFTPTTSKVTGLSVASMVGYTFNRAVKEVTAVIVRSTTTTLLPSDFNNGNTAIYAIIDISGSTLVLPTHNSHISIMNTGKETYRVYDASGAIYRDNLVIGNTVTVDGLAVKIGSVVLTMAVLTVSQLIGKGLNTSIKLIDAGFDAEKLELAGYMVDQLEIAGFTAKQLLAVGYTATLLLSANFTATRLQTTGFTSLTLETAGFNQHLLHAAHYTATQLQTAGYTATQLKAAGYTICELQELGYTAAQLKAAGYNRTHKPVKKNQAWLTTNSKNITFPERNEILCHASSAAGENVSTMEFFKTCVITFQRPIFVTPCSVEKRYATVTLYSNVINTETYGLTFRTRNIAGNLRYLVCFELNGNEIKSDVLDEQDSFSIILHENEVIAIVDDSQWFKTTRKVSSSTNLYKTKFNLNHDKTHMKNISFRYFQNGSSKISYTCPANLPSLTNTNTFTVDYQEGGIYELRDISAGGPTLTLHVQNLDLLDNRIPVISTLVKSKYIQNNPTQTLSSNAYTTRIYLSSDTVYDVIQTDTSLNIQEKLIYGKTVMQDIRYYNTDGSGHFLSDIQVYM